MHAVAIAYVMQKTPYVFPIVGGRKVEHLQANLQALDVSLSPTNIEKIESAVPFNKGTMYDLFVRTNFSLCGMVRLTVASGLG